MSPVGINTSDADFNTIGKTGGAKNRVVNNSNIQLTNAMLHVDGNQLGVGNGSSAGYGMNIVAGNRGTNIGATIGVSNPIGVNVLGPYKVVAYWKRIA